MSAFRHKNTKYFIFCVFVFVASFMLGREAQKRDFQNYVKSFKSVRENNSADLLISPILGTVSQPATNVGIYKDIKSEIEDLINDSNRKGVKEVSLYFSELSSPLWFGIKEDLSFAPASLFKLPIAIAAYKQSEAMPGFLSKRFVYSKELEKLNSNISTNDKSRLEVGKDYSVEELILYMIEYSDNGAKDLLLSKIDQKYLTDFFSYVNLVDSLIGSRYEISARKYSLLLRVLYNSSYLSEKNSQDLLYMLSRSSFKDGLVAKLPTSLVVAHKHGIYAYEDNYYFHDCGIIYEKTEPYVLCVMSKGNNIETLYEVVSNISSLVYQYQEK